MPRIQSLLFFVFLLILGGVFLFFLNANRNRLRPPPASAVWSAPDRPIKIVSFNLKHSQRGNRVVLDEIAKLNADIVLLQEVEKGDLTVLSEAFSDIPAIYHASENLGGARATFGTAILSRLPLYDAGAIPHPTTQAFGVWATAVIENKKFIITSIHLSSPPSVGGAVPSPELASLIQTWREGNAPPIIVGGDFSEATETNPKNPWIEALGKTRQTQRSGRMFISTDWKRFDAGIVDAGKPSHDPIWVITGK